jgi:hypothetical protein
MRVFHALTLTALLLAAPVFGANAEPTQKPGQWSEMISIRISGLSAKQTDQMKKSGLTDFLTGDPVENKDCVKPGKTLKMIAAQATEGMFDPSCKTGDIADSGTKLTETLSCPGIKGKGKGEYTLTDGEMTGKVVLDAVNPEGSPMHDEMHVDSKWVKDSCK